MFVNSLLAVNPFIQAFTHSDFLGKSIIISLFFLSICTWIVVIHKVWITHQARKNSSKFNLIFQEQKSTPLELKFQEKEKINPFLSLYSVLKKHTVEILNKNRAYRMDKIKRDEAVSYLSHSDIQYVETQLMSTIASQIKNLEKNLFILSTIVSLGPFLGLLGTVWGILTTFSELQSAAGGASNQMVIGGLSLALATTVLGLIDAVPALIGYNYLKNTIRDMETEMEGFSTDILSSVEMQYRKVDID